MSYKQLSEIFQLALDKTLLKPKEPYSTFKSVYFCNALEDLEINELITKGELLRAKLYVKIELNGERTFGGMQRKKGVSYNAFNEEQRARIEWVKSMIATLKHHEAPTYSCHN
jgi:hypothetical protein